MAAPFDAPAIRTSTSSEAYDDVLSNAGATKPERDAVDKRIVEEVKNSSGRLLKNDPDEVGGWPKFASGTPYADGDKDGIADDWEIQKRFRPDKCRRWPKDPDGDGWTKPEEFLHIMADDTKCEQPRRGLRLGASENAARQMCKTGAVPGNFHLILVHP